MLKLCLRVAVAAEQPDPQWVTDRQGYVCLVSSYLIFRFLGNLARERTNRGAAR